MAKWVKLITDTGAINVNADTIACVQEFDGKAAVIFSESHIVPLEQSMDDVMKALKGRI